MVLLLGSSIEKKIKAGTKAGYITKIGYLVIRVDGINRRSHRLAWLYMTGEWPVKQIDHINGDKSNNIWGNLREADTTLNGQNRRKAQKNNTSGLLGVTKDKRCRTKPWFSKIDIEGKRIYLGYFASANEAHEAYIKAKRIFHRGCTI